MKKNIRAFISVLIIAAMCLSLSSCNVFKTMRENAEKAAAIEIIETPDEDKALEIFNGLIVSCAPQTSELKENVSYKAGNPDILRGEEEAGLLDAAAKQLRTFIMAANPGGSSEVITPDDMRLLKAIEKSSVLGFGLERNMESEKVTDEKGNDILDDEGNNVTETHIGDNVLHLTFNYFDTEVLSSGTETDGEEEMTRIIPADDGVIAGVFGEPADKEAVLAEFDAIADYVDVSNYRIAYTDCRVSSDINLYENLVSFVRLEKNMKVTADITCKGPLAEYGSLTVTFPLTKTVEYTFAYPAEE